MDVVSDVVDVACVLWRFQDGDTALSWACTKGHVEVVMALLDADKEVLEYRDQVRCKLVCEAFLDMYRIW